jgi:hypothetical protein
MRMKAISSSLNNERRISFITAALVIISLIGVVHHFQSCHAFVPASRTSASTTSTPSSSSSSYSRRHSLLYVASSPPPPPSAGKTIKDGDDDDDNEEPAPLFTLDSTTTTTTSQDGGDGLYQVEEDRDAPSPMPDIPGSLSLDTPLVIRFHHQNLSMKNKTMMSTKIFPFMIERKMIC